MRAFIPRLQKGGSTMGSVYSLRFLSKAFFFSLFLFLLSGCMAPPASPDPGTTIIADAGPSQEVNGGDTVLLDGSASTSTNEGDLSYAWSQTAGIPVALTGANTVQATFTAPSVNGNLIFQLIVTDSAGQTDTDTVTITVIAQEAPTADAGDNQNVTGGDAVTLDGSGSSTSANGALTFAWSQIGGTTVALIGANTANPTFTAPDITGTLTFKLTVTDSQGQTASATVTVTVTAKSQAPTAVAGTDQNVQGGDLVTLDGSKSSDPNGSPLVYSWVQTSGTAVILTNANTANPTFYAPNISATLTFKLTVTNNQNLTAVATVNITITAKAQNLPPIANAGTAQNVFGGALVVLNGSGSYDPDGDLLTFTWVQLSGTPVILIGPNLVKTIFVAPNVTGTLTFELTVRDSNGFSATATVTITVTARPENLPPVANAGPDQSVAANATVTLDGSRSFDPEGNPITFNWTQTGGTPVMITGPTTVRPTFVAPNVTGILMFQLIVNDGKNSSAPAIVHVSVTVTSNRPPIPDAGPDEYVVGGSIVTLNGAGSRDPEGGVLKYYWVQTQGTPVLLTGVNTPKPTFVAPNKTDILVFLLTVTDAQGLSAQDAVAISVTAVQGDLAPICNAGPNQCVKPGATVTLDGSASVDPQGGPLTFVWIQTAGIAVTLSNSNTDKPTFVAPATATTLTFQLTVTNSIQLSASTSVTITVTSTPPVANAGPDQKVTVGETVQLDGSASSDPAGNPLTFSWVQTAGTTVDLKNPTSDKPTFIAPNATVTLTFQLTVDNGQGCTSSDTVNIFVSAGKIVLFVANALGNNVTGFNNPATATGDIAPLIDLSGASTLLNEPRDVAVTVSGSLLVANYANASITVYNDALATNGNVVPARIVTGTLTQLVNPSKISLDQARDTLYVINKFNSGKILVFAGVSNAAFSANIAPTRTITVTTGEGCAEIKDVAIDLTDSLYLIDSAMNRILVYDNASAVNGDAIPSRIITSDAFTSLTDLTVDKDDNLLVINGDNTVLTIRGASTKNGKVVPDAVLESCTPINLSVIVTDSQGTGYLSDFFNNAIYSFDNIAGLNGLLSPNRIISGGNTNLNGPLGMAVLEK